MSEQKCKHEFYLMDCARCLRVALEQAERMKEVWQRQADGWREEAKQAERALAVSEEALRQAIRDQTGQETIATLRAALAVLARVEGECEDAKQVADARGVMLVKMEAERDDEKALRIKAIDRLDEVLTERDGLREQLNRDPLRAGEIAELYRKLAHIKAEADGLRAALEALRVYPSRNCWGRYGCTGDVHHDDLCRQARAALGRPASEP